MDEPELGLHPFAIHKLAAMVRSAATRARIIVATQSATLVNQFTPSDIVVVERNDEGGSVFHRISDEETAAWMDEYSLGELWEKNIIGGRP